MITPDKLELEENSRSTSPINIKRILARIIRFWYLIVLSVIIALVGANLFNRYATRIYPVKASIIIKENEENIGAKFLYNNELVNPYRNHLNEIFIMKSYPLLQEVIESLNFDVAYFKEGDIKTTEYYDPDFPVVIELLPGPKNESGRALYFTITSDNTYTLKYEGMEGDIAGTKTFDALRFSDTVAINGYRFVVTKRGNVTPYLNSSYLLAIQNSLQLSRSYSKRLNVSWSQLGASVVDLEIQGPLQRKEIDFLNKFIERYQAYDVGKKTKESKMAINFLDNQLRIIGDSLRLYEDQVERFKKRNITISLKTETDRLYNKLLSFEDQKFQYRLFENYSNYISELLKNDQYDGVFTPSSVGIEDQVIASLITALIEEQAQVNLYETNIARGVDKTQDNPALQGKLQKIAFIKQDILKTIDNAKKTQAINLKFIDDQVQLVEQQLRKLPSTERELIDIQRNYSIKETLYVFMLQKRTEAGLSEASTTSDIVIVNPPMADGAITPKVLQNYTIALGIGLLLPFVLFGLAELLNNKVQSREDIEQMTSVPVIGGIGHNPEYNPLVVLARPRSAMAESFRALRSNLSYFTNNREHQVYMVTSSIPGEGKSFTALNLASVFALAGKKTLVIGADLRKPKLYQELSLKNEKGLSQYLSAMATLNEIVQPTDTENLFLLSGGPMPPNPSELLLKPEMGKLMILLREQFDCVILDTPPLGLITDAFVMAQYADHILFMVRQNYTPRPVLQALNEYYANGKFSNVSIVFNDLRKSGLGYGNYGYDYSYGYGYSYGSGYGSKKDEGGYYYD